MQLMTSMAEILWERGNQRNDFEIHQTKMIKHSDTYFTGSWLSELSLVQDGECQVATMKKRKATVEAVASPHG